MATQYAFYFDQSRCMQGEHLQPRPARTWNQVEPGPARWRKLRVTESGVFPDTAVFNLVMACNHCANPACLTACPVGAIYKRDEDRHRPRRPRQVPVAPLLRGPLPLRRPAVRRRRPGSRRLTPPGPSPPHAEVHHVRGPRHHRQRPPPAWILPPARPPQRGAVTHGGKGSHRDLRAAAGASRPDTKALGSSESGRGRGTSPANEAVTAAFAAYADPHPVRMLLI